MEIELAGEQIILCIKKAIWLKECKTLMISDLHIGKVNHFRKSGIAVPAKANDKNVERLIDLFNETKPERVIFLGDLFHSHYNNEWEVLGQVLKHFSACSFELVRGNHDILSSEQYKRLAITVHEDPISINALLLSHEPLAQIPMGRYNLAGHIHPGIRLQGKARQSMTLPCFYFGADQGLMPAFGSFTGLACITPKKNDRVFAVTGEKIYSITN
jgi:DNA ligase-associated metallophosphoesterase